MKQLTAALLVALANVALAQNDDYYTPKEVLKDNVAIAFGQEYKDVTKATGLVFVGHVNGYGYMIKSGKKGHFIDRIDEQMSLVGAAELTLEFQKNELEFEHAIIFRERLYILSSYKNKAQKKKYLFKQELDLESLKPIDAFEKIAELNFTDGTSKRSGEFFFGNSPDSSLVMVLYDIPGDKTSRERFGIQVFKEGFTLDWQEEAVLPYKESDFSVIDYKLDNDGKVYVLGQRLMTGKEGKATAKYKVQMFTYAPNSTEPAITDIEIEGKYVNNMSVEFKGDELLCIGFFGNEPNSGAQGCFVQSIDKKSGKVLHQGLKEFGLNFITIDYTDKQERKAVKKEKEGKEVGMHDLVVRQVLNHDGHMIVIAEEYFWDYVQTSMPAANGMTTYTSYTLYVYSDIVLFSISPEYEIEWYQKIPKSQVTKNDDGFYSSFFVQQTAERLLFVFNDHVKNLNLVEAGKAKSFNGKMNEAVAVAVTVDYNGNVGKTRLFSAKQEDIILRPKSCGRGLADEMVIFAQTKTHQRYGKVRIAGTRD